MTTPRPAAASSDDDHHDASTPASREPHPPAIPPSPYARLKSKGPAPAAGTDTLPRPGHGADATTEDTVTQAGSRPTPDDAPLVPVEGPGPGARSGDTNDVPSSPVRNAASPVTPGATRRPNEPTRVTAEQIETSAPMLRRRAARPHQGWQALAYTATRGRWNPGPGRREARHTDRERQIATQLRGKNVTAFFCLKGGVSKTSTTAATSVALANLRPDPVFAIDANPDAGDLSERLVGRQMSGISALAAAVDDVHSLDDLNRFTVTAGRLTMLPGEPSPTLGGSLRAADFRRVMEVVRRFYSFVQVDCGTGVTHPLMGGILEYADTVVVPAAWSITGARRAAETIDWLRDNGFEHLARTSIVVLTAKDVVSRNVDKDAVLSHLGGAADLVVVPADPHMADGALIDWELLQPATREAYLDIAAAITRRFETP